MTPPPEPVAGSAGGTPSGAVPTTPAEDGAGGGRDPRNLLFLWWIVPILVVGLGAAIWAVVAIGGGDDEPRTPERFEVVVPVGTQARIDAGETVSVMPARIELRVGDTLYLRNDDVETQSVGPYVLDPGEVLELQYGAPGTFAGFCPLSEGKRYEIVVTA